MKYLMLLVFVFGCGPDDALKKLPDKVHDPEKAKLDKMFEYLDDNVVGVFQNVVYNNGKYWLDTWACTDKNQTHTHWIIMEGSGMISTSGASFPYDSLVSGSFDYIKSVKIEMYKKAKYAYDYVTNIGIEATRIKDSIKLSNDIRKDSVEMLNKLSKDE